MKKEDIDRINELARKAKTVGLTPGENEERAVLRRAVEKSHELTPAELKAWVKAEIESDPLLNVIYYQSVDALTMQEVPAWEASERIQGCIAVQAGDIRLIDNIRIR